MLLADPLRSVRKGRPVAEEAMGEVVVDERQQFRIDALVERVKPGDDAQHRKNEKTHVKARDRRTASRFGVVAQQSRVPARSEEHRASSRRVWRSTMRTACCVGGPLNPLRSRRAVATRRVRRAPRKVLDKTPHMGYTMCERIRNIVSLGNRQGAPTRWCQRLQISRSNQGWGPRVSATARQGTTVKSRLGRAAATFTIVAVGTVVLGLFAADAASAN